MKVRLMQEMQSADFFVLPSGESKRRLHRPYHMKLGYHLS